MAINEKLIEVLNDLTQINNDRVEGYEKAAEETKLADVDLQGLFHRYADDSRRFSAALTTEVLRLGGKATKDTTSLGKIYRVWMDLKASFTGQSRQTILESCEYGEDAAQKAYRDALASDAEIDATTRQLITSQQADLKSAHGTVKKYRDMRKVLA
ncbi:hypothetical protein BH11BAC4_BH11BAC4_07730 [soil metagenome]